MALVPRQDTAEDVELRVSTDSSSIVLDSLPYVEELDPNYEQYAVSLIEDELNASLNAPDDPDAGMSDHPALDRLLPWSKIYANSSSGASISKNIPSFGGRAPLAAAAYRSLVERLNNGESAHEDRMDWDARPDPLAEREGKLEAGDQQSTLSDLQTSLSTSKIKLEQERVHLINLELHQQFETSQRWTDYHSQLEKYHVTPVSDAVSRQRRRVDEINAARMEEQEATGKKLLSLTGRREQLVNKNRTLNEAILNLTAEIEALQGEVGEAQINGTEVAAEAPLN